jgi:hypothetical protein
MLSHDMLNIKIVKPQRGVNASEIYFGCKPVIRRMESKIAGEGCFSFFLTLFVAKQLIFNKIGIVMLNL